MRMVGGADHHRIDLFVHFIEHHPVILKTSGFRHRFISFRSTIVVYIAEGYNVLIPFWIFLVDHLAPVALALSANSNYSDVKSSGRRTAHQIGNKNCTCAKQGCRFDKVSSGGIHVGLVLKILHWDAKRDSAI